ncbi:hypothetical protein ABZ137_39845 [Streptomyces bobili]|uniref:hypothetical protein n=1 Tax=Streptomyces bobili TaxID=67280 RepID=UPI0033B9FCC9
MLDERVVLQFVEEHHGLRGVAVIDDSELDQPFRESDVPGVRPRCEGELAAFLEGRHRLGGAAGVEQQFRHDCVQAHGVRKRVAGPFVQFQGPAGAALRAERPDPS